MDWTIWSSNCGSGKKFLFSKMAVIITFYSCITYVPYFITQKDLKTLHSMPARKIQQLGKCSSVYF
jgi:hypothetical protein